MLPMYPEFWFCGLFIIVVITLIVRECYLFIKLKVEEWQVRVYGRLLRHEMMLRLAIDDRQGNVYTGSDDRANNRYGDIYFIEPNSEEAARIREQLEKDDKELPSYDEVMRMCNLTSPTPAPAAVVAPALPSSTDGVAISVAALPAPPYVEVDPNAQPPSITPSSVPPQCTVVSLEPSTSRAAQTTTSSSVIMTLSQTASNTEV
ncbi:uncharacterized protein LOC115627764 isoform X4 [Scaptodrosophila lebanonensis]|uniref:Uncharacterized protein LOC115627764 isoform X4 n=1 Tax=Drosophila lebanonensis TaxID=7225 RepID=A0A6J2TWA0_DROLE|nr:uncharacterized protein LOC115627764 isoform X4 [Scaptodrosophila lebanonensis]